MSQLKAPSKKINVFFPSTFLIILLSCKSDQPVVNIVNSGQTVSERISPPSGYKWVNEEINSFGAYLQQLELETAGSKIVDYKNQPISNQQEHVAILSIDIGNKDLQQCADAVIRLRAEYLWAQKRYDEIAFHFTSGDLCTWNDYKMGIRPVVSGNKVTFKKSAAKDDSYSSFRKYLDLIFMYAGTISLNKETVRVTSNSQIKAGDILVTPGSPGHALIIVGCAVHSNGDRVYLLAQGYTPAQSIHIITNPYNNAINPWYDLNVNKSPTVTARYTFKETNIRRFK